MATCCPHFKTLQKGQPFGQAVQAAPQLCHHLPTLCLENAGIMVVTDASLGNVTKLGGAEGSLMEKVYSQSA